MITFVINCPGYLREEDLIEKLAQKVINQEGYFVVNNNLYYSSKSSVFRVENELSEIMNKSSVLNFVYISEKIDKHSFDKINCLLKSLLFQIYSLFKYYPIEKLIYEIFEEMGIRIKNPNFKKCKKDLVLYNVRIHEKDKIPEIISKDFLSHEFEEVLELTSFHHILKCISSISSISSVKKNGILIREIYKSYIIDYVLPLFPNNNINRYYKLLSIFLNSEIKTLYDVNNICEAIKEFCKLLIEFIEQYMLYMEVKCTFLKIEGAIDRDRLLEFKARIENIIKLYEYYINYINIAENMRNINIRGRELGELSKYIKELRNLFVKWLIIYNFLLFPLIYYIVAFPFIRIRESYMLNIAFESNIYYLFQDILSKFGFTITSDDVEEMDKEEIVEKLKQVTNNILNCNVSISETSRRECIDQFYEKFRNEVSRKLVYVKNIYLKRSGWQSSEALKVKLTRNLLRDAMLFAHGPLLPSLLSSDEVQLIGDVYESIASNFSNAFKNIVAVINLILDDSCALKAKDLPEAEKLYHNISNMIESLEEEQIFDVEYLRWLSDHVDNTYLFLSRKIEKNS